MKINLTHEWIFSFYIIDEGFVHVFKENKIDTFGIQKTIYTMKFSNHGAVTIEFFSSLESFEPDKKMLKEQFVMAYWVHWHKFNQIEEYFDL